MYKCIYLTFVNIVAVYNCRDIEKKMIERLEKIIEYADLSIRAFAIKCGIHENTLDKQMRGHRSVSLDTVMAILNTFPQLSAEWLMRGEGKMFKDKPDIAKMIMLTDTISTLQGKINDDKKIIDLLNEKIGKLENKLKKQ